MRSLMIFVPVCIALLWLPQLLQASLVQGEYIGTFNGNDSEAEVSTRTGVEVLLLARVNYEDNGTENDQLKISDLAFNENDEPISGQWEYFGTDEVDFFAVKAGPDYALYRYTDANTDNMRNIGIWDTTDLGDLGMSHVTAYTAIPEPTSLSLFGACAFILGLWRRR